MRSLEQRYRWLLRAYPAWYRRERAAEILGTLLEASPPGRRWPSFRDTRALVIGGLRARGWAFFMTILWAGPGAAGAGYDFIASIHVSQIPTYATIPCWVGEPGVIIDAGYLGGAAWLLLTIPVRAAGIARLRRTNWAGRWPIPWIAGLLLMIPIANWQTSAPAVMSGNCWVGSGLHPRRIPLCRRELGRGGSPGRVASTRGLDDLDTGQDCSAPCPSRAR